MSAPPTTTVSSATCACLLRPSGELADESASPPVPSDTFAQIQATVIRMHHDGVAQQVIEHDGWVADIGWVEGRLGVGYMVWLHRPGVRSGTDAASQMSPRQLDVARRAARGERSADIADALGISVYTVRDHLKVIYSRLGIASRLELAEIIASLDRLHR